MPYEIPQKLQYEEKILFGLTFRQLLYLMIFGLPALIIFLKTNIYMAAKVIISLLLLGLAAMFMFFNFSARIKNFVSWSKFKEAWLMDPKMKEFLGVEKVENNVLYTKKEK